MVQLHVDTLEVLADAPLTLTDLADEAANVQDLTFDRYGTYIAVSSSDGPDVKVCTESGVWVGAADPAEMELLIATFEERARGA